MTRIYTITYDQAKKWYDSGRKYKPIGTKLTNTIWLNYDEANDRSVRHHRHSERSSLHGLRSCACGGRHHHNYRRSSHGRRHPLHDLTS